MSHKFAVGEAVEFKPIGANVGVFIVLKQMPKEFQASDFKYRIKSQQETFERNVLECNLSPSLGPADTYEALWPVRLGGRHH